MNARDVMTRDVVSFASDTPMRKMAALLVEKRISGVPVVVRDGRIVGIVRRADLVRALAARPHIPVVQGRM